MAEKRRRRAQKVLPHILRTFEECKRAFDEKLENEVKTALKKSIESEESYRRATITHTEDWLKSHGADSSNVRQLPQPQNARADIIQRLYRESVPNIKERADFANEDRRFLRQMTSTPSPRFRGGAKTAPANPTESTARSTRSGRFKRSGLRYKSERRNNGSGVAAL